MTCQPDELLSSNNLQLNLWLESAVNLFLMVRIPSHQPGDHMTKTLLCLLLWVTYLCAFCFLVLFNFFHVCPKVFLYFFIFIKSFFLILTLSFSPNRSWLYPIILPINCLCSLKRVIGCFLMIKEISSSLSIDWNTKFRMYVLTLSRKWQYMNYTWEILKI